MNGYRPDEAPPPAPASGSLPPQAPSAYPLRPGQDPQTPSAPWERLQPPEYQRTQRILRPDYAAYDHPTEMVYYPQLTTPPQEWDYDDAPPEASDRGNKRLLASSGSIAVATLTSRITGFFKSMLLLAVLGSAVASSYTVASQIPNMISEFVLGAVLSAIVVPVLVRAEREDPDGGATFVRRLCTAAFTMLTIATILAVGTASFLVPHFFLPENGAVNTGLTTALSYLLLPAVLFYGMSALFTAILNTRQVFKPGAWAPVLNNVVVLVVLGIYFLVPGEISLDRVRLSDPKLLLLGVGLTLGVVMQALCLLPAIRRERIDLRPLWGIDDRLKRAAGMGAAIVLYVAISQAGLVFGTRIAAAHDAAGPAIYQTAWMLLQLPYGVLGVTVLTAIMPRLSRNAAEDDTPAVVDDLSVATRLTMIALIPVVLFMTLTGRQMGEALYGHGNMTFHEAGRLGLAVSFSAFTLIPYALVLIHLRVFYAREQAWTPTWIILGITGVKVALSALVPVLVHDKDKVVLGLGLVNGLAFITGAVIGGILLHRSLGELRMVNVGRTVWRVVLASAAGGVTVLIADRALKLQRLTDSHLWLGSGLRVALAGCLMLAVTFAIMWLSGVPEIVGLTVAIMRRLGLRAAPADAPEEPKHRPYDPLMDAETMILPVIRARAVDTTGAGDFPYPVRQRGAGPTAESGSAHEGAMVSDDAVTGLPTGRRNPDVGMGVGSTGTVPPGNVMPGRQMHTGMGPADEDRVDQVVSQQESNVERPAEHTGPPPAAPMRSGEAGHGAPGMPPPAQRVTRGPKLIPGASVAGGRYRLLAAHGGSRGLVFWQALDIKLDREVALTFVDADQRAAQNAGEDGPQAILSRTLRLGRISSPGLARVLDVVRGSSGGIVVAEWTPGRSLREMAETRPSPIGAARAMASLAAATELTHRSGGALSIDHPDRVRISVAGDAVLAFPGTLADADVQSDVRGLGAMLYALMLARWPLGAPSNAITGAAAPSINVGGLRPADFTPAGVPVEPRAIRPEVPFEISAVAVRALEPHQGVRTAATLQHVLEQASVVDQKTEMLPSLRVGRAATPDGQSLADPGVRQVRSKRTLAMMAVLGTVIVLLLCLVGFWLANMLSGGGDSGPLSNQDLGFTTPATPSATYQGTNPPASGSVNGVPVSASNIVVYSPKGTPDNPSEARNVLGGSGVGWHTETYFQQFPALKPGIGLMATLPSGTKLTTVTVTSPSAGTQVEIRTSPTDLPTLDQTTVIARSALRAGTTKINIRNEQPAHYVLIWITKLANNGEQYQSAITDLTFTAAA